MSDPTFVINEIGRSIGTTYIGPTDTERTVGVEIVNPSYPPGSPERYGNIGLGDASADTVALQAAALTGYAIRLPEKTSLLVNDVVNIAQLVFCYGADDGQTNIELLSGGQFRIVDQYARFLGGMKITSSVNGIELFRIQSSYFSADGLAIVGSGTGQTAFRYDTAVANIYQTSLTTLSVNGIDTPFVVTGDGVFNNNSIGDDATYVQNFVSALTFSSSLVHDRNTVSGYFEGGTNFVNMTAGVARENTFPVWLDLVTNAVNTSVGFASNNWPNTPPDQFVTAGIGTVVSQVFAQKISFRAYRNTTDQSIADNTVTKIEWNAETFDTYGVMVLSPNYRMVATRAAKLYVVAQADISGNLANGDRTQIAIRVNGADIAEAKQYVSGGSSGARPIVADIVQLAKGDYMEVFAIADETAGSGTHNIAAGSAVTYFAGYEI